MMSLGKGKAILYYSFSLAFKIIRSKTIKLFHCNLFWNFFSFSFRVCAIRRSWEDSSTVTLAEGLIARIHIPWAVPHYHTVVYSELGCVRGGSVHMCTYSFTHMSGGLACTHMQWSSIWNWAACMHTGLLLTWPSSSIPPSQAIKLQSLETAGLQIWAILTLALGRVSPKSPRDLDNRWGGSKQQTTGCYRLARIRENP